MTAEEKHQLTLDLAALPDSELYRVREVISADCPHALVHAEPGGPAEINVNALDDHTLRRIQQYIRISLLEHGRLRFVIMAR